MYEIPLPLSKFHLESSPDEVDLTMTEKRAIRNVWALVVSPDVEKHALEQANSFLAENVETFDKFRHKNGTINMKSLHAHKTMVFETMEHLIFEGLESNIIMHDLITPIAKGHMINDINQDEIKKMVDHLREYFHTVFYRFMSPTVKKGFDKIFHIILMAYEKL